MQRADQLTNPDNEQREQQLAYVEEEFYELLYAYRNESRAQVIKNHWCTVAAHNKNRSRSADKHLHGITCLNALPSALWRGY